MSLRCLQRSEIKSPWKCCIISVEGSARCPRLRGGGLRCWKRGFSVAFERGATSRCGGARTRPRKDCPRIVSRGVMYSMVVDGVLRTGSNLFGIGRLCNTRTRILQPDEQSGNSESRASRWVRGRRLELGSATKWTALPWRASCCRRLASLSAFGCLQRDNRRCLLI